MPDQDNTKSKLDELDSGPEPLPWLEELPPRQIVVELDRYIVGQDAAKKAVAIAIRNRWRRQKAPEEIRDEILPNNIIMIGPTGVGKTEIARRLARLSGAPFIKVEASKFTEVGYVGRDVESMIRDLVDSAINMVRGEREDEVFPTAEERTEQRLIELLFPGKPAPAASSASSASSAPDDARDSAPPATSEPAAAASDQANRPLFVVSSDGQVREQESGEQASTEIDEARHERTRDKLRALLRDGKLEDRVVEVEVSQQAFPILDLMQPQPGMDVPDINLGEALQDMLPKRTKKRELRVSEARRILIDEELKKLVDMDDVVSEALDRVENHGIIFIDELDKIAGERGQAGPDVSREGVQRDLLPIVEGSTVQTRYGYVRSDHILFIAAGAFHVAKPSDLIPEMQGRFPIRVELSSLNADDFVRIMTEPENSLVKQYKALCAAEDATLEFTDDGIKEIALLSMRMNDRMENIGARRLHTVMTTLLEEVLFNLPEVEDRKFVFDAPQVRDRLLKIVEDEDLRKYIL